MNPMNVQQILRLPDELADDLRLEMKTTKEEGHEDLVIDIRQDGNDNKDYFVFVLNGKSYPALLQNLPTIVETHKTFDRKVFLKSGEIGQVLQVFWSNQERQAVWAANRNTRIDNDDVCMPNGLTPPTEKIVKNRFQKARPSNLAYSSQRVKSIADEMHSGWSAPEPALKSLAGGGGGESVSVVNNAAVMTSGVGSEKKVKPTRKKAEVVPPEKEIWRVVQEEVVSFEDWMATPAEPQGIKFSVDKKEFSMGDESDLLIEHPEILVFEADVEDENIRRAELQALQRTGAESPTATSRAGAGGSGVFMPETEARASVASSNNNNGGDGSSSSSELKTIVTPSNSSAAPRLRLVVGPSIAATHTASATTLFEGNNVAAPVSSTSKRDDRTDTIPSQRTTAESERALGVSQSNSNSKNNQDVMEEDEEEYQDLSWLDVVEET